MNHDRGERATSNRWLVESVHCRIRRGKPWSGRAKKNPLRTKPWKKHPCFVPFPSWTRWERRQGSSINSLRSPLTPPPARGGGSVQGYVLDKADDIIDAPAGKRFNSQHIQVTAGPQLAQGLYRPPERALSQQCWLRASSRGTRYARPIPDRICRRLPLRPALSLPLGVREALCRGHSSLAVWRF